MTQVMASISFPEVSDAQAGQCAQELRSELLDALKNNTGVDVKLVREDQRALGVGSVIVLHFLSAFAAEAIAVTIIHWVKWNSTKVRLKNGVYEMDIDHRAGDDFIQKVIAYLTGDHLNQPEPVANEATSQGN